MRYMYIVCTYISLLVIHAVVLSIVTSVYNIHLYNHQVSTCTHTHTPHAHARTHAQETSDTSDAKTFCRRVSHAEYESQMKAVSQQSITSLLDRIASDENMTDRERRQKLKLVSNHLQDFYVIEKLFRNRACILSLLACMSCWQNTPCSSNSSIQTSTRRSLVEVAPHPLHGCLSRGRGNSTHSASAASQFSDELLNTYTLKDQGHLFIAAQ